MKGKSMFTPWGKSDSHEETGVPGVTFYSTPSHGGYLVTGPALERIPIAARKATWCGRGLDGWFEEDEDWAIVAKHIPEAFPPEAQEDADLTLLRRKQWLAAEYAG